MTYMETIADRREKLEKAVETLATSEGWAEFLKFRLKFHNYSWANGMLIAMQCPGATHVTGYGAKDGKSGWLALGRQVRKGEKAIKIYAPILVKDKNDPTGKRKVLIGFKIVSVFDVSQTDGDPIPEDPNTVTLLEGDAPDGYIDALMAVATAEGLTVVDVERQGGANGWIEREHKLISIVSDLSNAQRAKTLTHEIAHWFDLQDMEAGTYSRAEAECVAESAAYIVCSMQGLASDPYSVSYVAGWSQGNYDTLKNAADRTDKAAKAIVKALEKVRALVAA